MDEQPHHPTPPRRILRLPDVKLATGLQRATIYKLIEAGDFPKPVRLTPRAVGWKSAEIDEWIDSLPRAPAKMGRGVKAEEATTA